MATDAGECKQYCGMPLLTDVAVMMRINPLALIQELGVVCQPSFGNGLLRAELGGTEGAKRVRQRRQAIWKNSGAGLGVDGLQQQF